MERLRLYRTLLSRDRHHDGSCHGTSASTCCGCSNAAARLCLKLRRLRRRLRRRAVKFRAVKFRTGNCRCNMRLLRLDDTLLHLLLCRGPLLAAHCLGRALARNAWRAAAGNGYRLPLLLHSLRHQRGRRCTAAAIAARGCLHPHACLRR